MKYVKLEHKVNVEKIGNVRNGKKRFSHCNKKSTVNDNRGLTLNFVTSIYFTVWDRAVDNNI